MILSFVTLIRGGDFLWHAVASVSPEERGEKALLTGLRSLPQDGRAVLVVDAPTMLSAPRFLAKEWNLDLHIAFLSQFRGCPRARRKDEEYALSPMSLSVEIPSCASYVFAGVPDDIQSKAAAGILLRPGIPARTSSHVAPQWHSSAWAAATSISDG